MIIHYHDGTGEKKRNKICSRRVLCGVENDSTLLKTWARPSNKSKDPSLLSLSPPPRGTQVRRRKKNKKRRKNRTIVSYLVSLYIFFKTGEAGRGTLRVGTPTFWDFIYLNIVLGPTLSAAAARWDEAYSTVSFVSRLVTDISPYAPFAAAIKDLVSIVWLFP